MKHALSLYQFPELYESVTRLHTETEREVTALDTIFKEHGVHSVLDLACGIGRHSIPLAERGYTVVGIDRSEQQIAYARQRAQEVQHGTASFVVHDVNNFELDTTKFDAAICMWTTFAEKPIVQDEVTERVLHHLTPGGIFVIENRTWEPEPKPQVIEAQFELPNGVPVVQHIEETYEGAVRQRKIEYTIGDKHFVDYRSTNILRNEDIMTILTAHGFHISTTVTNYKKKNDTLIVGQKVENRL